MPKNPQAASAALQILATALADQLQNNTRSSSRNHSRASSRAGSKAGSRAVSVDGRKFLGAPKLDTFGHPVPKTREEREAHLEKIIAGINNTRAKAPSDDFIKALKEYFDTRKKVQGIKDEMNQRLNMKMIETKNKMEKLQEEMAGLRVEMQIAQEPWVVKMKEADANTLEIRKTIRKMMPTEAPTHEDNASKYLMEFFKATDRRKYNNRRKMQGKRHMPNTDEAKMSVGANQKHLQI